MSEPARADTPAPGRLRPELWLLDAAIGAWLAHAAAVFRGTEGTAALPFTLAGAAAAAVGGAAARHGTGRMLWRLAIFAALAATFALSGWIAHVPMTWGLAVWLAAATMVGAAGSRGALHLLGVSGGRASFAEALRLTVILATGVFAVLPFYTARSIGAGDADWYVLMLADFAEQIRRGIFPVWLGQTEYAFNGAFSPLRLAPWFQHFGGLLDQLTLRTLDYVALKNAVLAANAVLLAGSAYACLRAILRSSPTTACGLAVLLTLSPAMLAPLYVGDQYMTFMALPFLPVVCYGLWRAYEHNDLAAHALLAAALAGLWLAHTPIALWTSLLATLAYLGKMALHRARGERACLAVGAAVFLLCGAWPILSALSLDNVARFSIDADTILIETARAFPANLGRLSDTLSFPSDYQPGAALLALLLGSALLLPWRRHAISLAFLALITVAALFTLPVPRVTEFLWRHLPDLVRQVTNIWPMQRLVPIAGCLAVFLFATLLPSARPTGRHTLRSVLLLLLGLPLAAWSLREVWHCHVRAGHTRRADPGTSGYLQPHNLTLTRYAYASFESAPSTFSHGYLQPALEHRLRLRDHALLASNLESAARKGALPAPDPDGSALLAHGTFSAVNDNGTTYYNLAPALELPARTPLVLWLEPLEPELSGWFQVLGQDVFREYLLPDSGEGVIRRRPTTSFGTTPTSVPIVPLYSTHEPADHPRLIVIAPKRAIEPHFPFARYELWRYDPAALPVNVHSLAPYRLTVNTPEPAYLETPRVWLRGYRAQVNGQSVQAERSPDNLVMFPVPAGRSEVTIRYSPGFARAAAYWVCLGSWLLLLLACLHRLARAAAPPLNG